MSIQSDRELEAWQLGMEFVVGVYGLTKHFPREERYGLTAQLRRAAVSVPSNTSEGHRQGSKIYRNSVLIALGSRAHPRPLDRQSRWPTVERVLACGSDIRLLRPKQADPRALLDDCQESLDAVVSNDVRVRVLRRPPHRQRGQLLI
jgi:23S rRNA-intervening sequence protein